MFRPAGPLFLNVVAVCFWLFVRGTSAFCQDSNGLELPPGRQITVKSTEPESPKGHFFNVRDFAAAAGQIKDTDAIMRAIQAANQSGGGEVLFPPGAHLAGTFEILSNLTLNLQAGAVLLGSADVADYGDIAAFGFDHNLRDEQCGYNPIDPFRWS